MVYELGLEIRPGSWPDQADRLAAELISRLTAQEAQTQYFPGAARLRCRFSIRQRDSVQPFPR